MIVKNRDKVQIALTETTSYDELNQVKITS